MVHLPHLSCRIDLRARPGSSEVTGRPLVLQNLSCWSFFETPGPSVWAQEQSVKLRHKTSAWKISIHPGRVNLLFLPFRAFNIHRSEEERQKTAFQFSLARRRSSVNLLQWHAELSQDDLIRGTRVRRRRRRTAGWETGVSTGLICQHFFLGREVHGEKNPLLPTFAPIFPGFARDVESVGHRKYQERMTAYRKGNTRNKIKKRGKLKRKIGIPPEFHLLHLENSWKTPNLWRD